MLSGDGVTLPAGIHFVSGDVTISTGTALLNGVTIVATGSINISSTQISLTPFATDLPALFAGRESCASDGIKLSTSNLTVAGAVFAPTAQVSANSSVVTVTAGALVGTSVRIGASRVSIDRRTGFVRLTAMCAGVGGDAGNYKFRVRHEGETGGLFPYDLRIAGTVLHSGVISAGEEQFVWLVSPAMGVKVIATGGWTNEYDGTASSNSTPC
jgi:hypothetical protein